MSLRTNSSQNVVKNIKKEKMKGANGVLDLIWVKKKINFYQNFFYIKKPSSTGWFLFCCPCLNLPIAVFTTTDKY